MNDYTAKYFKHNVGNFCDLSIKIIIFEGKGTYNSRYHADIEEK